MNINRKTMRGFIDPVTVAILLSLAGSTFFWNLERRAQQEPAAAPAVENVSQAPAQAADKRAEM